MRTLAPVIAVSILVACTALAPQQAGQVPPAVSPATCGPLGKAYMRTTLYFGTTYAAGVVTESQWRAFLRKEVTPRFPDGLTVWEANGQWRRPDGHVGRERAKVLLLVHDESPAVRASVAAIISKYKKDFQQESVLWETAQVCATF